MAVDENGDLVDGIIASSMHSFISQLKADYQRELRKALTAAIRQSQEGQVAAADPDDKARAMARKAQSLRKTGQSLRRTAAAPEPAAPPSGALAPQLLPIVEIADGDPLIVEIAEGDPPGKAEMEQPPPEADCPEQHSRRVAWETPDGDPADEVRHDALPGMTVPPDVGGAGAGSGAAALQPRVTALVEGPSKAARKTNAKKSFKGFTPSILRNVSMFSEEDFEMVRENKEEEKRRRMYAETKRPDWEFYQKKNNATTASKKRAFQILTSRSFDIMMGVVIILNSATIGVETSYTVRGDDIPTNLVVIEYLFLFVYVVELSLRFHAVGVKEALSSNWVKFDTVLVVSGLANFVFTRVSLSGGVNVNMLKMLRLVRLARTVRVVVQFRTMWLLVQGLMHALLPMFWTCILMMMVVYTFAILGMETVVGSSDEARSLKAQENFHTMGGAVLTFMQMMALDSTADIYRPLIEENWMVSLLFLVFFMIGPIALMSIVTAIMVESSLRTANEDLEAKRTWEAERRKAMIPKLKSLLEMLDTDNSGDVELAEMLAAPKEIQEQLTHICDLPTLAVEEVFHMLDVDKSGSLDIEEFVNGILHWCTADKPPELLLLVQMSKSMLDLLNGIRDGPDRKSDRHSDVSVS